MASAVAEAVDVAVEVQEAIVEAEAVEGPEVAAASASFTASPEIRELASSPRRRGAAAAKATGATLRTMSRPMVRRPTTPLLRIPPRRARRLRTRRRLLRTGHPKRMMSPRP